METKEIVKLVEAEKDSLGLVNEMKPLTRGEHHLLELLILALDKMQVKIEGED